MGGGGLLKHGVKADVRWGGGSRVCLDHDTRIGRAGRVRGDVGVKAWPHVAMEWAVFCDFEPLEASQSIAVYRNYLLQNRSSLASQLPTMDCFHIFLQCSSPRW